MPYDCLLADADGTLFNFHAGERIALRTVLQALNLPDSDEWIARYSRINDGHWKRLERGETTQSRLRVERFEDFLQAFRADGIAAPDVTAADMAQRFVYQLGLQRIPLPGVEEFLRRVSAVMPIYLVTNGISVVQRNRFEHSELRVYLTDLLISEELGAAKPDPTLLLEGMRRAQQRLGHAPHAVLMGDSVTADIGAARNAGVDSILFTNGAQAPADHSATYVARTYEEAAQIILG